MFENSLIIEGLLLKRTCYACPEQYDVEFMGTQIGYLRLRHGSFTASYIDYNGPTVYHAYPQGDGIFEQQERMHFLKAARTAILDHHNEKVIEKLDSHDE